MIDIHEISPEGKDQVSALAAERSTSNPLLVATRLHLGTPLSAVTCQKYIPLLLDSSFFISLIMWGPFCCFSVFIALFPFQITVTA